MSVLIWVLFGIVVLWLITLTIILFRRTNVRMYQGYGEYTQAPINEVVLGMIKKLGLDIRYHPKECQDGFVQVLRKFTSEDPAKLREDIRLLNLKLAHLTKEGKKKKKTSKK